MVNETISTLSASSLVHPGAAAPSIPSLEPRDVWNIPPYHANNPDQNLARILDIPYHLNSGITPCLIARKLQACRVRRAHPVTAWSTCSYRARWSAVDKVRGHCVQGMGSVPLAEKACLTNGCCAHYRVGWMHILGSTVV